MEKISINDRLKLNRWKPTDFMELKTDIGFIPMCGEIIGTAKIKAKRTASEYKQYWYVCITEGNNEIPFIMRNTAAKTRMESERLCAEYKKWRDNTPLMSF